MPFSIVQGLIVLNISQKHAGPSGIFIATGAIEHLKCAKCLNGKRSDCVFLSLQLLFLCALLRLWSKRSTRNTGTYIMLHLDILSFRPIHCLMHLLYLVVISSEAMPQLILAFPEESDATLWLSILVYLQVKRLREWSLIVVGFRTMQLLFAHCCSYFVCTLMGGAASCAPGCIFL